MTKHSRQHNDVVSAHERAHVNSFYNNKWGTMSVREGNDARGNFDSCCLCLVRAKEPMLSPNGNVYCKSCIYEFMLTQKQHQKKQMEMYEKQQAEEKISTEGTESSKMMEEIEKFHKTEESFTTGKSDVFVNEKKRKAEKETGGPAVGYKSFKTDDGSVFLVDESFVKTTSKPSDQITEKEKEDRKKFLPCFWIPNLTPDSGVKKIQKPESVLRDPLGHKLKIKNLTPIKYTLTPEAVKNPKLSKDIYICPISKKTLTNGTKCFLVKTTGDVMTQDSIELILSEKSWKGTKVSSKDIIQFANTGTGFAAGGARLVESINNPAFTYG